MSDAQNLVYALIQVAHNFGAMAAFGGSLAAVKSVRPEARAKLAGLALGGWIMQGASGAAFGATSYYFYHQLPELSQIAVAALFLKMACVAVAVILLGTYLLRGKSWSEAANYKTCLSSLILAVTALSAAAFLRWFS